MIKTIQSFLEFPLLRRELIELAQRRRTYALRCLCLFVFTLVFLTMYASMTMRSRNLMWMLGQGREMTMVLFATLLTTIYALAPAMACAAITSEKEKQTLGLLLISKLSPAGIVIEKIFSRLLPLLSLVVVSAPLFAISYLFGGLSFFDSFWGLLLIVLVVVQITTIAIFCSALLESGIAAFWMTYVILALIYFTWPVLHELGFIGRVQMVPNLPDNEFLLFPVYIFAMIFGQSLESEQIAKMLLPSIAIIVGFAVAACFALKKFSFGGAFSFEKIVQRLGVRLSSQFHTDQPISRSTRDLPQENAIWWRERRFSLINKRWVQSLAIAGVIFLQFMILASNRWDDEICVLFSVIGLIIAMLLMMSLSCKLFAKERERQTFDSLLASPLRNREILNQKLSGINRITWVLLLFIFIQGILNLTCVKLHYTSLTYTMPNAYFRYSNSPPTLSFHWLAAAVLFFVCSLGNSFIYMNLIKWVAVYFGLKLNTQMKAMVATLISILVLCFVPVMLCALTMMSVGSDPDDMPLFFFLSPVIVPALNEWHDIYHIYRNNFLPESDVVVICCNFAVYGSLTLAARSFVLRHLGELMNRRDQPSPEDHVITPNGPFGQQLY